MTAFQSPHWHRIAATKPRLRRHTEVSHHRYRSQSWYVLHDPSTGKVHRFTPAAYAFVKALDGHTTIDAIWRRLTVELEAAAPSQEEIVKLIVELHEADILQGQRQPDADALQHHVARHRRSAWLNALKHPLSVTIPLWNADAFLTRHAGIARALFSRGSWFAWWLLLLPALFLATTHADELVRKAGSYLLSHEGVLVAAVVFPLMKLIHEAGHALALKAFGGKVHRTGVIMIAILPMPYVDASAAAALPSKWQRIVISAAGMMAEIAVAAIGLYVWLIVEPGLVRDVAFSIVAVAVISVAIVNGNPLLRFDGYYILSDLIEIPNLAQRSTRFWSRRLGRWLAGVHDPTIDFAGPGERVWFILYGPLAFIWRIVVLVGLSLWIATEYLAIGILIALVALLNSLVVPFLKGFRQLLRRADGQGRTTVVQRRLAGLASIVVLVVGFVPMPLSTLSEGIVALPETAYVRATADGFVREVHAGSGHRVSKGDRIVTRENLRATAEIAWARARIDELNARLSAEQFADRVAAAITRAELVEARHRHDEAHAESVRLTSHAEQDGVLVGLSAVDLPGRYFAKGETIALVRPDSASRIRALVGQNDIELLRSRLRHVSVLVASDLADARSARIVREIPAAGTDLPSRALTVAGGGQLPAAGTADEARTNSRVFQIELELDRPLAVPAFGARVFVRFDHHAEPLLAQAYRRLRQLLLSHFHA